jgi:endo-1,4-beta-xylanase
MTSSELITRAQGSGLVSALTFDDGPNGAATARLLDFLAAHAIPAVFCVIGQHVREPGGAELLRRMVDDGHLLCNHSTSYADMGGWSRPAIEADLVENLRIIRAALEDPEAKVPYFRAPNGSWGETASVAASLGMRSLGVLNTIDDWTTQDLPTLTANLRAAMRPGELVLAHDGGGEREATVDAVAAVVTERLAQGWSFTLPDVESRF